MFENALFDNKIIIIALVIGLIIGVVSFIRHLLRLINGDKRSTTGLEMLTSFYMIGVVCKALVLGPEFVRWYLGDIGFPVALGYVLSTFGKPTVRERESIKTGWDMARWRLLHCKSMIISAWMMSIGYEVAVSVLYHYANATPSLVGGFDPVDVAMYTIGMLAAMWFIRRERVELNRLETVERERIAQAQAEAKKAARVAHKAARKSQPSTRRQTRKGGRK